MRPTDENQSPSMRPNLMSSRRPISSGEDSILAMLEREPARKRKGGASRSRLAWYGASAMLAVLLTGSLVWMAANNDGRRPNVPDAALADAGNAAAQPEAVSGTVPVLIQVAMAPLAPPEQRSPAVIVDQPPADAVPPLRLLKPAPDRAAPPVRVPVPAPPPRPVAKTTPAPRPVAAAPAEPRTHARPAAPPAKPKPALVAKNAAKPAPPKTQRGGAPARSGEAGVDADVALISAVIVHANGHAPEGSQMTELLCPNDNCKARPARE